MSEQTPATTKPLDTEYESADESPGFLLWQVANIWQRRQRAALKPLDLTHVQFVLLMVLSWETRHDDGGLSQIELANKANTDPMMTSQVLRALAARDLVERLASPHDTRANLIRVTPAGRALAALALPVVEAIDREFFGPSAGDAVTVLRAVARRNAK